MKLHKGLLLIGVSALLLTACSDDKKIDDTNNNGDSQIEQTNEGVVSIEGVENGGEIDTDENGKVKLIGSTNQDTPVAIQASAGDGSSTGDVVWVKSDENGNFSYEFEGVDPTTPIVINFSVDYEIEDGEVTLNDNPKIAYVVNVVNPNIVPEVEEDDEPVEEEEEVHYDDPKEQFANNVFGDSLRNYYTLEEDGMIDVYIEVDIPMGITENMMKRDLEYDIVDLSEQIKDEDFTHFIVIAYAEGSDAYGNDTEISVGTVTISKETANQINYDNFNIDNLETVADNYNLNIGK